MITVALHLNAASSAENNKDINKRQSKKVNNIKVKC